ncbi:glycosyltransferase family 4 protein [Actinoplanes sp. CA-030573]|uniref:glycosyltransferase family 4 protein n=1 Tax=Actinoplanes sp. CA-030573 TaxID=3239898 RepID=UPI003D930309
MSSPLWAVLPGTVDDPAAPSGGNRYDRIVLNLLTAGDGPDVPARDVHEIAVPGDWPSPAAPARDALARALSDIPDKADVLVDGLVGCGVPEILQPHRHRLRIAVLVHLPLSDETGLAPAEAAARRNRERTTLHMATKVIATSRAAARRITDMHDLPPAGAGEGAGGAAHGRVWVVEPGVSPAECSPPDRSGSRLLCVAAVSPRKGQDLLVAALEEHLADLRWTCTFAGALIKPVAHRHQNIRFAGALQGTALDSAYGKADLLVLPSRAETYGMVVTEALARGLPVIATDVGGVSEALGVAPNGERPGLLVPPDDVPALAGALRTWLTDAGERERLRTAARARRGTLPTWHDTARRLSEVLDA